MSQNVSLPDNQQFPVGFEVKSRGGVVFPDFGSLPTGSTVSIVSSDPSVAEVVMRPDGLNADVKSPNPGTATVTLDLFVPDTDGPDGAPEITVHEEVLVTVTLTPPGSATATDGAPTDE